MINLRYFQSKISQISKQNKQNLNKNNILNETIFSVLNWMSNFQCIDYSSDFSQNNILFGENDKYNFKYNTWLSPNSINFAELYFSEKYHFSSLNIINHYY